MTSNKCKYITEEATLETNLIKRGVAFNKASQCYKNIHEIDQFKLMKGKAIEAFQKEAEKIKDSFEKSLINSYEALCWICLEEIENAKAIVDKIIEMDKKESDFTPPPIVDFTRYLTSKEIEKAEALWKDIYKFFNPGIIKLLEEAFTTVNPSSEPPNLKKIIKIFKTWNVSMAGDDLKEEEDWIITFYDAAEIFKEKIVLKSQFFDDLVDKIQENEHYHFIRIIRTIASSSGENFSDKAMDIILSTSAEKKIKFGAIFGHLKDGGLHVLALWPESLAKAIVVNKNIFGAFIIRIIQNPEWFSDVNLITYLPKEEESSEEKQKKEFLENIHSDYYT